MPAGFQIARAALLLWALGASAACGDHHAFRVSQDDAGEDVDAGDDAGFEDDAGTDAGPDGGLDAGLDGGRPGCTPGKQYVFTFDLEHHLRRFDPETTEFAVVGTLACPTAEDPFSMAIDRSGRAWVEYSDGSIYFVDTTTAACTTTPYVARVQQGFSTFDNFGMGFAAADITSPDDQLFVSDVLGNGLGIIDVTSYQLQPVGPFSGFTGGQMPKRAELTGTGDGRLFGGFEGAPFLLAQIDQKSGQVLWQAPLAPLVANSTTGSNFALASYGSDFWIFFGNNRGTTQVYKFTPSDEQTRLIKSVNFSIVGAGVSTCASQ